MDAAGYPASAESGFVGGKRTQLGEACLVFGRTGALGRRSLEHGMPFGIVSGWLTPGSV